VEYFLIDLYHDDHSHSSSEAEHDYPNDEGSVDKNTVAGQIGNLQETKSNQEAKDSSTSPSSNNKASSSIYYLNNPVQNFLYLSLILNFFLL